MAPKKAAVSVPTTDARHPVEIEFERTIEAIAAVTDQLQKCKDGIDEIAQFSTKIRTLEQDLQPKELEHKSILSNFQKIVENAAGLKRPTGMIRTQVSSAADDDVGLAAAERVPGPQTNSPPQSQQGSRPATVPAPMQGSSGGLNAAGTVANMAQSTTSAAAANAADDGSDRDAIRALAQASRAAMQTHLQSVFDTPMTAAEKRSDKEGTDVAAVASLTRKGEQTRFDFDLACPIGIEPSVFYDVLRVRAQRILVERSIQEINAVMEDAKNVVAKRKDEGASKALQKKLEKQLDDTKKRLVELQRAKEELEIARRNASATAAQESAPVLKKERSASKVK